MKIPVLRRLDRQDISGKDQIPDWIDSLLGALNTFLDPVGKCLQRRMTFADQFYGVQTLATLKHGVESVINPVVQSGYPVNQMRVVGITLIDPAGEVVTGFGWNRRSDGTISVIALYRAGGTTTANCLLQVQFG
jgi:hypothetical protein